METAPAASKPHLEAVKGAWGFVPQLHAVLAESPLALAAYDGLFTTVAKETTFAPDELQAVYIAVSVFHGCEYCTMGHTWMAREAKLDEGAIQALRNGDPISNQRLQALRAFTESVVRERGMVGEDAVQAFIDAGFTKAHVLDIITVIAVKTISNYTNHVTHTPKEGFMADAALAWVSPRNRKG
jgi:AhpD family alkylhydroperoxidase